MNFSYNLTGAKRKALVQTISEILGKPAVYQGAPTFAYAIDSYSVDKNGTLGHSDGIAPEDVQQLVSQLRERGYTSENDNVFTVGIPKAGFTATALDNLKKIIASKAELFKRAIGTDRLEVITTENTLKFPWFTLHGLDGETDAYTKLIVGICDMAKRQKRVVARERPITNDKFTMRVFLIRLGFIGPEYQTARTLLLRNLTGNSSWLTGPPPARHRRNRKRLPPPPAPPAAIEDYGKNGEGLLNSLADWLLANGVIVSDEERSNEHVGVRTITVCWRNKNYLITQVDGITCKVEKV